MAIDSQEIIEDLGEIAFLLNDHGICSNNKALYDMQNDMRTLPDGILWQYGSEEETYGFIEFQIPRMSHTRPEDIDNITISLAVNSQGSKDIGAGKNHFKKLDVQLVLSAYSLDADGNNKIVKGAWHMDMDTNSNNDFVHPLFHINFGGKQLEEIKDIGEILLLRSPRIMHPPMDIFLAIDFIVQNFIGRKQAIYQDFDYQRIISKYKKLHWTSYALAFAYNFHPFEGLKIDENFKRNILGDSE